MLYESNWPRLQMLKYGPLAMGLFSLTFIYEALKHNVEDVEFFLIFIVLYSATFVGIFILLKDKLKFVTIGKTVIMVKINGKEKEYKWLDVEQINLNRFFGVYKLKIKDEDVIYFTSYGFTSWVFGDLSDMGEIIKKMKRELDI